MRDLGERETRLWGLGFRVQGCWGLINVETTVTSVRDKFSHVLFLLVAVLLLVAAVEAEVAVVIFDIICNSQRVNDGRTSSHAAASSLLVTVVVILVWGFGHLQEYGDGQHERKSGEVFGVLTEHNSALNDLGLLHVGIWECQRMRFPSVEP